MTVDQYLRSIHAEITKSRARRNKPCLTYAEWFTEINALAAAERARVLGLTT